MQIKQKREYDDTLIECWNEEAIQDWLESIGIQKYPANKWYISGQRVELCEEKNIRHSYNILNKEDRKLIIEKVNELGNIGKVKNNLNNSNNSNNSNIYTSSMNKYNLYQFIGQNIINISNIISSRISELNNEHIIVDKANCSNGRELIGYMTYEEVVEYDVNNGLEAFDLDTWENIEEIRRWECQGCRFHTPKQIGFIDVIGSPPICPNAQQLIEGYRRMDVDFKEQMKKMKEQVRLQRYLYQITAWES